MPISEAPYKRTYEHTKARGREKNIICGICGRIVPKYKTFVWTLSFSINDPIVKQNVLNENFLKLSNIKSKVNLCPSCARFRGIKQPGKAVRKKHLEE